MCKFRERERAAICNEITRWTQYEKREHEHWAYTKCTKTYRMFGRTYSLHRDAKQSINSGDDEHSKKQWAWIGAKNGSSIHASELLFFNRSPYYVSTFCHCFHSAADRMEWNVIEKEKNWRKRNHTQHNNLYACAFESGIYMSYAFFKMKFHSLAKCFYFSYMYIVQKQSGFETFQLEWYGAITNSDFLCFLIISFYVELAFGSLVLMLSLRFNKLNLLNFIWKKK